MTKQEKTYTVKCSDHEKPGLYLTLKNSTKIKLTRENIERTSMEYWQNPDKIPSFVKNIVEFQRCSICPLKKKEDLCDALRPLLPLLDVIDDYSSFDEVAAVYKGDNKELYHLTFSTMQRALRYISTLSLMGYCQVGRKYWKYFNGIIPVMGTDEIVNRIYLNIYWIHKGDMESVDRVISQLNSEISVTARNQTERLRHFCKNDAFLNAFVLTHMITDVLYDFKDAKLLEQMERFEADNRFG